MSSATLGETTHDPHTASAASTGTTPAPGGRRQGLPLDAYTLPLLDKHLPPNDQRMELVTLLQAWMAEGDPEAQRETGEYLVCVLDEDRLVDWKLFPSALKDVTW